MEVVQWRESFAADRHENPPFVPLWLDELDTLPRGTLLGSDESLAQLDTIVDVLLGVLAPLNLYAPRGTTSFAFKLQHTVVLLLWSRLFNCVTAFRLSHSTDEQPPSLRYIVRSARINTGDPVDKTSTNGPSGPHSAALVFTEMLAANLGIGLDVREYSDAGLIVNHDRIVARALSASNARSYTLLRLLGSDPVGSPDFLSTERLRVARQVRTLVGIAWDASQPSVNGPRESATLMRRATRGQPSLSAGIIREAVATFYHRQVAHMQILPVTRFFGEIQPFVFGNDIRIEEHERQLSVIEFLRLFSSTLTIFAGQLPPSAFPFVIPVTAMYGTVAHNIGALDPEGIEGVITVRAQTISFVQLGEFDGETSARRITLDRSHTGDERVAVMTVPEDAPFDDLRGIDPMRINHQGGMREPGTRASRVAALFDVASDQLSVRRGAALAPLFDQCIEAHQTNAVYSVNDIFGLLVFANAYAQAPANEKTVLLRIYLNYTRVLQTYVRDLLTSIYRNYDMEQFSGSESSTDTTEPISSDAIIDVLSSSNRNGRLNVLDQLKLSQVKHKKKKKKSKNNDDDDSYEEKPKRKRNRVTPTTDSVGNELNDDEHENFAQETTPPQSAVPPPRDNMPLATPVATAEIMYVAHDLTSRAVFNFLLMNNVASFSAIQSVERSFSRVLVEVDSELFRNIWMKKYPLLAAEFNGRAPFDLFGQLVRAEPAGDLLPALYYRVAQIDSQRDGPSTEAYNLRREIDRLRTVEGEKIGEKVSRLAELASIVSTLNEKRTILEKLITRYEGRALVVSSGQATVEQRRRNYRNRAWTLLMAAFDNISHHPFVRQKMLEQGLGADNVEWLKTVDADLLTDYLPARNDTKEQVFMEISDDNKTYHSDVQMPFPDRFDRPYSGRYYIAKAPMWFYSSPPSSLFVDCADERTCFYLHVVNPSTLLTSTSYAPPISTSANYQKEEALVWIDEASVDKVNAYPRRTSYFAAQALRQSGAVGDDDYTRGPARRILAARYWHKRSFQYTSDDDKTKERSELRQELHDDLTENFLVRGSPTNPWREAGFRPTFSIVAVDQALLAGLLNRAALMPFFNDLQRYPQVLELATALNRAEAVDMTVELLNNGELEATDGDVYREALASVLADMAREKRNLSNPIWATAVQIVLARESHIRAHSGYAPSLSVVIVAEIEHAARDTFESPLAYTRAQAGSRVFKNLEHDLLRFMFSALVIKRIMYRHEDQGDQRLNVGSLSPITRLFLTESRLVMPRAFTVHLDALREQVALSFGAVLDQNLYDDLNSPSARADLANQLRMVGITPEDYGITP
jgi:hypothetical protein